ncbi:MAG: endonuclease domain-containing protein [Crocinitomicaceae bacterium]
MYYNADKILFEYAAQLRKQMTPEEKILWEELRHSRIGVKFGRQHPISRFIVDFYCHKHKLVIEVDGKIHLKSEIKTNDLQRENELKELGLTVIRFSNEQVQQQLDWVLKEIKASVSQ